MNPSSDYYCVFITAPEAGAARQLAKAVLEARLAACVNIVPKVESHYWWKGELEFETECLLICKTTRERMDALKSIVKENHPYEVPEIIGMPIADGLDAYLQWITNEVKPLEPL